MFESPKRHHLSRAPLALTPGRDKPEGASAWELRGYVVESLGPVLIRAALRLLCFRRTVWLRSWQHMDRTRIDPRPRRFAPGQNLQPF